MKKLPILRALSFLCISLSPVHANQQFDWRPDPIDGTSGFIEISDADYQARSGTAILNFEIRMLDFVYAPSNSSITPSAFQIDATGGFITTMLPTYVASPGFSSATHHLFFDGSQIVEDTASPTFFSKGRWFASAAVPDAGATGLMTLLCVTIIAALSPKRAGS